MEEQDNIYYFLEISVENSAKTMAKIKEIGLTEENESPKGWLLKLLESSQINGVKNLLFLVSNSEVFEWDETVHQNYQSKQKKTEDLLIKLGIPIDEKIPNFKLDDILVQQKQDIVQIRNKELFLDAISPYRRTEAVCMEALNVDVSNFEWIPLPFQTNEILAKAFEKDGFLISEINPEKLTSELCLIAVRNSEFALTHVPNNLLNDEICKEAISRHPVYLSDFPENLRSREIVNMVMEANLPYIEIEPWAALDLFEFNFPELQHKGAEMIIKHLPEDMRKDAELVKTHTLDNIPPDKRSVPVCTIAVLSNHDNIRYVPQHKLDSRMIEFALRRNGKLLEYIPKDDLTTDLCFTAVKNNFTAIEFVDKNLITREICRNAINEAANNFPESCLPLAYTPYPDICLDGIRKLKNTILSGEQIGASIKKEVINEDIARELLNLDINNIHYLPTHLRNKDRCEELVKQNGWLLCAVPEELKTKELCLEAIKGNYEAIRFVPPNIKTSSFCLEAAKIDGNTIALIPEGFRSRILCEQAVRNSAGYTVIAHLPYPDLCNIVIDRNIESGQIRACIDSIRPECINNEIAQKVAEHDICSLPMVPKELFSKEFCDFAIQINPKVLIYLPDSYKTKEVCLEAIRRDPAAIIGIPDRLRTNAFYKDFIEKDPANIFYIPEEFKTRELAKVAIESYLKAGNKNMGVFASIPFSDICLKAIEKENDPKTIVDIVMYMRDEVKNTDIALQAVKKNGACLPFIPDQLKVKQVCEEAIKNAPEYINWTPIENRSPDMYLRAIKENVQINDPIPKSVLKGSNILSFNAAISKKIMDNLHFDQVQQLYNGKTIKVDRINTSQGIKEKQLVRYDKASNSLEFKSDKESRVSKKEIHNQQKRNGFKL